MNQEEYQLKLWERLQIVLREYDTLRAQILQLIHSRNSIANFGIAFIGVLMLIGVTAFKDAPQLTYIIITVIAPLVSISTLALVTRDIEEIHRIGYYLRKLEIKVAKMIAGESIETIFPKQEDFSSQDLTELETSPQILLFWENWVQAKRLRSNNYSLDITVYFYLFLGLSLTLQVHSLVDRSVNFWWKLIVLIAILFLDLLTYFALANRLDSVDLPNKQRKRPKISNENSSLKSQG